MQTQFKPSLLATSTVGPGVDVPLIQNTERTEIENKWFALRGRVVAFTVEADGDIHIALRDTTREKPGIVVCEVPAKLQ